MKINENFLNECMDKIISKKYVFSTVLRVESGDGSFIWTGARGEMKTDSRYFIASVTKLYITAVIMSLIEDQELSLDDKISKYLPDQVMDKLHIFKGVDYSGKLTIKHLLSNTSGIPDYFFHKEAGKKSAADSLLQGIDEPWGFDKAINASKKITPKFIPGKKRKASYSDTNYQLLGKIIETVTQESMGDVFKTLIFNKLNLCNTYAYNDIGDNSPVPFYYKDICSRLPNYMASITPEGGIVSTAEEVMLFIKAFFSGYFFDKHKIEDLKVWNYIMPPPGFFGFGIGLEKIPTPRIISPLHPISEILGFWGQTSALAWYNTDTDLYFTGTANQANGVGHNAIGNVMIKIIKAVLKEKAKS